MEISQKEELPAIHNLNIIFSFFHKVVRQLGIRHGGRRPFEIKDEYDVQDFLLKNEKIVIEVKKTREGLEDKELGEQLIIDINRYKAHPDCEKLACFVYDPEERIHNPAGIMNDLNKQHDGFAMVIIKPGV